MRRSARLKAGAPTLSDSLLLVLGLGVLVDVARRTFFGSEPESCVMNGVACVSLVVNTTLLRLPGRFRKGAVHLPATQIFTRADVIANIGVTASGLLVLLLDLRYRDLVAGAAIGCYVVEERGLGRARRPTARRQRLDSRHSALNLRAQRTGPGFPHRGQFRA
jgi:Co/Zn/Cd efflux system component